MGVTYVCTNDLPSTSSGSFRRAAAIFFVEGETCLMDRSFQLYLALVRAMQHPSTFSSAERGVMADLTVVNRNDPARDIQTFFARQ
jgi:hypothetical protein